MDRARATVLSHQLVGEFGEDREIPIGANVGVDDDNARSGRVDCLPDVPVGDIDLL
jgi:hypothetical protein